VSPAVSPPGVGSSPECFEPRLRPPRPFAGAAPSRRNHTVPGPAGLPLVRFLLPRTQLRRVPLLRHRLPCGRPCGTRIARPSSVPSSGFLPLSTVPASTRLARGLLNPAVRRGPRRFAVLFHTARVPGAPLQSFPFPGSRTRSRGPSAHLRVRSPTRRRRCACRIFSIAFARPRRLVAARAHPKVDPELMRRDVGSSRSHSPVASKHRSAPHVPSASHRHWARR
jgi:hypothetical protein